MSHAIHNTRVNSFSTKNDIHLLKFSIADINVRKTSTDSQDTGRLTNIECDGLTAPEAKYH